MRLPGPRRRDAGPRLPDVRAGERALAHAPADDGTTVAGTRDALYVPVPDADPARWERLAWEAVESAEWDAEEHVLDVVGVGPWGEPRPRHAISLQQPDRLLQLVRERVTASIVLQQHVPVRGRRGLTVVGRRAPRGGPVRWFHSYDEGVDPGDPQVRRVAEEALAAAREQVGD